MSTYADDDADIVERLLTAVSDVTQKSMECECCSDKLLTTHEVCEITVVKIQYVPGQSDLRTEAVPMQVPLRYVHDDCCSDDVLWTLGGLAEANDVPNVEPTAGYHVMHCAGCNRHIGIGEPVLLVGYGTIGQQGNFLGTSYDWFCTACLRLSNEYGYVLWSNEDVVQGGDRAPYEFSVNGECIQCTLQGRFYPTLCQDGVYRQCGQWSDCGQDPHAPVEDSEEEEDDEDEVE